jgi:hypothetical protein
VSQSANDLPSGLPERRGRTLARLAAYSLVVSVVFSLLLQLFPIQIRDPAWALARASLVLDQSPLLVIALVLLYYGIAEDALPALWECRLALLLRQPLRLLPLLYLGLILVIGFAGSGVEARSVNGLRQQLDQQLRSVTQLRDTVKAQDDVRALLQLVDAQPMLQIVPVKEAVESVGTLSELRVGQIRRPLLEHLEQLPSRLQASSLRSIANASGNVVREQLRLGIRAVTYGLFFLLAGIIWPRSMAGTMERVRRWTEPAASR